MKVSISVSNDDEEQYWIDGIVEHIETPPTIQFVENGIKVRIDDGTIGNVKRIHDKEQFDEYQIEKIISGGETLKTEFKETFKVNSDSNEELKCLRDEVVKEIAAFMNTEGGVVIIGVDDSNTIVGLGPDYVFVKPERETQTIQDKLKQEIRSYVKDKILDETLEYDIIIKKIDDKEICIIDVPPSTKPVFVDQKILYQKCGTTNQTKGKRQNFYIRTDSGTLLLDARKIFEYWSKKIQS